MAGSRFVACGLVFTMLSALPAGAQRRLGPAALPDVETDENDDGAKKQDAQGARGQHIAPDSRARLGIGCAHGDRRQIERDFADQAAEARPVAVAFHQGGRGILRPTVALQARRLEAARLGVDRMPLPIFEERHRTRPRVSFRMLLEVPNQRLLGRRGLVGGIARVGRSEAQDAVGEGPSDVIEDASGNERRGHRLREELSWLDAFLHLRTDAPAHVVSQRQVELGRQPGLLVRTAMNLRVSPVPALKEHHGQKCDGQYPHAEQQAGANESASPGTGAISIRVVCCRRLRAATV